jgi:hypothetical protein
MQRIRASASAAAALALVAAGCGGGGGGGTTLPGLPGGPPLGSANAASARFVIKIPAKAPANASRRRHYVTSSVTGVSFSVAQAGTSVGGYVYYALNLAAPYCSGTVGSTLTCTVNVVAPPGTDTFTVDLYDYAGASGTEPNAGYVVAVGNLTQAIAAQTANTVNITTDGVPTFAVMGIENANSGSTGSYPIDVDVTDPNGYFIVGSYDAPLTLADSDTSGDTSVSATTLNQDSDLSGLALHVNTVPGSQPTLTLSSTDNVVASETGSVVIASASYYPGVRGVNVAPAALYFSNQAAAGSIVTAISVNGGSTMQGVADDDTCKGIINASFSSESNPSDVRFSAAPVGGGPTTSTGAGPVIGTCEIGFRDLFGDETFVPVIVGSAPTPVPSGPPP